MKIVVIEGMPEKYGVYTFIDEDGELFQGLYDSFAPPHHYENTVKCCDFETTSTEYRTDAIGYLAVLKEK